MTQLHPDLIISVITHAGAFHIEGLVNGSVTLFHIDTGAAVTLMRKDMDRVNTRKQGVRLEPWVEQQLVSINGTPSQVYGHAAVDLSIDETVYLAGVVVVSPLTIKSYIGFGFYEEAQCVY